MFLCVLGLGVLGFKVSGFEGLEFIAGTCNQFITILGKSGGL